MKLKTTGVVTFGVGAELGLSKDQAAARRDFLVPMADKDGWYIAKAPVQFKAGEQLEYAGELPKGMVTAVSTPAGMPVQPKAAARRKAAEAAPSGMPVQPKAAARRKAAEAAPSGAGGQD